MFLRVCELEFEELSARYDELSEEKNDLGLENDHLEQVIKELNASSREGTAAIVEHSHYGYVHTRPMMDCILKLVSAMCRANGRVEATYDT